VQLPGYDPSTREPDCRPRFPSRGRRLGFGLVAVAALTLGCSAPKPAAEPGAPAPQPARPLAALATQPVALLPAQYLRLGDSASLRDAIGPSRLFLSALDSAIAGELAVRATATPWIMADALTRSAKRNPAFTSDPHALSAESLRSGVRRTNPRLGEPLASQIRSLVALTEARFGLVPAEVRFEPLPAGGHRAILRLVLVDARLAEIVWTGDVAIEVAAASTPAVAGGLAKRVADLLVAP
jgi:hypothetical protein